MTDIFIIIFLFVSIGFVVIVELLINKGKLKRVDTYSYKAVVRRARMAVDPEIWTIV